MCRKCSNEYCVKHLRLLPGLNPDEGDCELVCETCFEKPKQKKGRKKQRARKSQEDFLHGGGGGGGCGACS